MGYSYHLKLPKGTLKVKSASRLRDRERDREVPVWRVGGVYFVWQPGKVTTAKERAAPPF